MFSAALLALDTADFWIDIFVNINDLLSQVCADQLYGAVTKVDR